MRWNAATLGEIAERDGGLIQTGPFGSQLHQSDYVPEGIPVIMPKDITSGRVDLSSVERVSEETASRLSRHQLRPRTIVLPRRGEITKRAFVRNDQEGWLCGTGCLQISLEGQHVLPEFLYYYMEQQKVARWLEQHAVGTTMLNLSTGIVADLPLKYPAPTVQCRIADILSAYDDLIENNRRRIALLEEAARLLYREWFIHFRFPGHEHVKVIDGLPEGWERRKLGGVVEVVKESVKPSDFDEQDIHIGLEHIPRRSFTLAEWEPTEGLASGKWRFEEGDILFCKIRPYFHKVGFTMRRGLVSSDALVWRVHDEADWPVVLCAASSDHFVAVASKTVREGSKMPRADWKVLQEYIIPKPPGGLLEIFNDTVRTIAAQCKTLALQNKALAQARDLLLPRLMNGEIAV